MFIINKYKSLRASSETRKNLSVLKQPALSLINDHLIAYPTPSNLNYFWGFGSLAGSCGCFLDAGGAWEL